MPADPLTVDIDVRFRDLDPMGHVNNAVYATYLEHARVAYYAEVLDVSLVAVNTVIVHLEIDYRSPVEVGDTVEVAVWVPRLGESSIPMAYEVGVSGELAATAETVQVLVDQATGRSRPIPEEWRRLIDTHEGR